MTTPSDIRAALEWHGPSMGVKHPDELRHISVLQQCARFTLAAMEEPSGEMLEAVSDWIKADKIKTEEERAKEPLHGMCGCIGPMPLCRCARRRVASQYKVMTTALFEQVTNETLTTKEN